MRDLREHRMRKQNLKAGVACLAFITAFTAVSGIKGYGFTYDDAESIPFVVSNALDRPLPAATTEEMSLKLVYNPITTKYTNESFIKLMNYNAVDETKQIKAAIRTAEAKQAHSRDPYYYMHEKVVYRSRNHLNKRDGVCYGPSGRETYYNLDMKEVVARMRRLGYSAKEYPYWVRSDGAKMLGPYVMVAANLRRRPRGTILECSLGTAIVVDTGGFAKYYPKGLDVAVNW